MRRLGDVYSTAHLINSLSQGQRCEISLLVYNESEPAAQNLVKVKKIYTVDRLELITITTNKLFTSALALDRLMSMITPIKEQEWDMVINYSNDQTGAYLASFLQSATKKTIGIHYNKERNIETSSMWEIIFNDVLPSVPYAPIHFVDCYHRMAQVPIAISGDKIKTNKAYDESALENITNIRTQFGHGPVSSKIVGIQITTSSTTKSLPISLTKDLIKMYKDSGTFIPLIFIAPTAIERELANTINEEFGNELIVVEANLNALASVLSNIDLLITPDTAIKHIADLTNCPVIEISLGEAPFLKQGSFRKDALILTDLISNRNADSNETLITAQDIFASSIFYFSKSKSFQPRLSSGITLYSCEIDHIGAYYIPIAGENCPSIEITRLMSRQFITSLLDNYESNEIYNEILTLGSNATFEWCKNEKTMITEIMKDLLGTLRSLLQSLENKRSSRDFIINLSKLMGHEDHYSSSQVAIIIFKTKVEAISAKTFEENTREVELLLYELKSFLQINLARVKKLEDCAEEARKNKFMNRSLNL